MGWTNLYSPLVPSGGGVARQRPDLRGAAAAALAEVAAVADKRRSRAAELAEVADGAVTPFARPK
uniref:Uncharacterized protein n=1 Tax=Oryza barthii TaxID=65489 RepID=A0A0D3FFU1_9ORYZ